VTITEWFMDSHEVSEETQPGSDGEGLILLSEITRPGQVPLRCLLDGTLVNLMVPLCVSATHVGWGTIRLESVFMQLGEAAGFACALARETDTDPGHLDADLLLRRLEEVVAGAPATGCPTHRAAHRVSSDRRPERMPG